MWVHLRAASGQRYSKPAWRLLWRLGVVCLLGRVRALSPLAPLTRTFSPSGICGDIQRAGALCQGGQAAPRNALHLQDHGACTAMNRLVTVCTASPSPSPSPILSANHPMPRSHSVPHFSQGQALRPLQLPLTQSVFPRLSPHSSPHFSRGQPPHSFCIPPSPHTQAHTSVVDSPLTHPHPPSFRPTLQPGTAPPAATVCSQRRRQCHQCRSHPWCCPLRR